MMVGEEIGFRLEMRELVNIDLQAVWKLKF
jgi:hypothetical protein